MSRFRKVSVVSLSLAIQTIFGAIFYILIARLLPATEVGALTLFLSFEAIFATAFSLNFDTGFVHFISYLKGKTGRDIVPMFFYLLSILMTSLSLVVIVTFSKPMAVIFFHSSTYQSLVIMMGIYVAETICLGFYVSILQGMQMFEWAALSNVAYSSLSLGLPTIFSALGYDFKMISLGFVMGGATSLILSTVIVFLSKKSPETSHLRPKTFLSYTTPIFFGSLFTTLMSTVDRVILPALTNLTITALYIYSLTIATIVTAVSAPFTFFILPKISEYYGNEKSTGIMKFGLSSMELYCFIAFPASLGGAILAQPLLVILVGGIYEAHFRILQIMFISYSLFSMRPILSSILLGFRQTKIFIISGLFAFMGNLILSILLIPTYGIYGAVIAVASGWALSTVPRIYAVKRMTGKVMSVEPYLKMWINAGLMALIVLVAQYFTGTGSLRLVLLIILGLAVYLIISRFNSPLSYFTQELILEIVPKTHRKFLLLIRFLIGVHDQVN